MLAQQFGTAAPHKDYYQLLGVTPDADLRTIDQAYWNLARAYNASLALDAEAKAKLEELNEAYSVLGSRFRRKAYDLLHGIRTQRDERPSRTARPPAFVAAQLRHQLRTKAESPPPFLAVGTASLALAVIAVVVGVSLAAAGALLLAGLTPAAVVLARTWADTGLGTKSAQVPQTEAQALPARASRPVVRFRPANLGEAPIPGGRSRRVRRLVYQVYEQCPHLGPTDLQAVVRYVLLTERFLQGERRLREFPDPQFARYAAAEQRELAAELREHELALGITTEARARREKKTAEHEPKPSPPDQPAKRRQSA